MKLMKCPNNHFYNADKLPYCPQCAAEEIGVSKEDSSGLDQHDVPTAPSMDNDTLRRYTTGWLVCINGPMQGESFTLYEGENQIGRGKNMNISLSADESVHRASHADITYNKDENTFILTNHSDTNPISINGETLNTSATISYQDTIQIGCSTLLFIPLCNDEFNWFSH